MPINNGGLLDQEGDKVDVSSEGKLSTSDIELRFVRMIMQQLLQEIKVLNRKFDEAFDLERD
jgi:hypothetical protein